jgi:hypothetical protein
MSQATLQIEFSFKQNFIPLKGNCKRSEDQKRKGLVVIWEIITWKKQWSIVDANSFFQHLDNSLGHGTR